MVRHLISLVSSEDVGDIMIADPVIAVETETVDDAIRKMIAHDLGELPVVDERGWLLGSISIHTILEAWLQTEGEGVGKDTSESKLTQS
jgi:CBS domain-containing protein